MATSLDAAPVILISRLAQHRRNIDADPRASLLFDGTAGHPDPLEGPRVSVMGTAAVSAEAGDRRRFLARHPGAHYADFADFDFFRIEPERVHLVAGFGRVHWLEGRSLRLTRELVEPLAAAEAGIVGHMNDDHADAVALCATVLAGGRPGAWRMAAIDPEGADLELDGDWLRLDFPAPAGDPAAVREVLVALAREARSKAARPHI